MKWVKSHRHGTRINRRTSRRVTVILLSMACWKRYVMASWPKCMPMLLTISVVCLSRSISDRNQATVSARACGSGIAKEVTVSLERGEYAESIHREARNT